MQKEGLWWSILRRHLRENWKDQATKLGRKEKEEGQWGGEHSLALSKLLRGGGGGREAERKGRKVSSYHQLGTCASCYYNGYLVGLWGGFIFSYTCFSKFSSLKCICLDVKSNIYVFPNNNLLYAMNRESVIFCCRWGLRKITSGMKGVCYFVGDTLT